MQLVNYKIQNKQLKNICILKFLLTACACVYVFIKKYMCTWFKIILKQIEDTKFQKISLKNIDILTVTLFYFHISFVAGILTVNVSVLLLSLASPDESSLVSTAFTSLINHSSKQIFFAFTNNHQLHQLINEMID